MRIKSENWSPLGPVLANIFVGFCETLIPDHLWPRFYKRYVDDTFSLFTNEEESMAFFQALNCVYRDLQFTMEREKDNSIAFLDIKIMQTENGFKRTVYRKKDILWGLHCLGLLWTHKAKGSCNKIAGVQSKKNLL